MQVAQRSSSVASITTNNYYTADRFGTNVTTLGTWTQSVENDAPTGSGFRKSLKMLCTTADASPAAGDLLRINQVIEGQNLQHIKKGTASAEQLTVSFWVKANVTGTYIVEFLDNDNTRQVSKSYTVNTSGTWEYKTLTFPADATGAFDNDNAASLYLQFWLGAGTNFTSGTLQTTWASTTDANRAVGQVNLASATNNYWQVTGVQLEVGSVATEFEFLPADVELAQCQRYYYLHASGSGKTIGIGFNASSTAYFAGIHFPVTMRDTPNLVSTTGTNYYSMDRNGATDSVNSLTIQRASTTATTVFNDTQVSGTSGQAGYVYSNDASALVAFSAEL
jgi:hypothetical protein